MGLNHREIEAVPSQTAAHRSLLRRRGQRERRFVQSVFGLGKEVEERECKLKNDVLLFPIFVLNGRWKREDSGDKCHQPWTLVAVQKNESSGSTFAQTLPGPSFLSLGPYSFY